MKPQSIIIRYFISSVIWIALLLIFLLIIIFIVKLCVEGTITNLNNISVPYTDTSIINALFYLISFAVAAITLKITIDIQTIDSLAKLRSILNSDQKKEIHQQLIKESGDNTKLTIEELDYIGTIELATIMYKKGIISDKELYNQFGYRVENIIGSSLYSKVKEESEYYEDFFTMERIINKYVNH